MELVQSRLQAEQAEVGRRLSAVPVHRLPPEHKDFQRHIMAQVEQRSVPPYRHVGAKPRSVSIAAKAGVKHVKHLDMEVDKEVLAVWERLRNEGSRTWRAGDSSMRSPA